jgi:uncharacterized membrane protein (DUF2068 family)
VSEPPVTPVRRVTQKLKKKVAEPDFGLKLIIIWKAVKAVLLLIVAVGSFALIHKDVHAMAESFVAHFGLDPTSARIGPLLAKLGKFATPTHKVEIGLGAAAFAAFLLLEAWGLWHRRVWAEVLTIVATSLLIPVEVYELCRHPGFGKVLTLLVNMLVVLYLARHHYLFVPGPIGRWLHAHLGKERPAEDKV